MEARSSTEQEKSSDTHRDNCRRGQQILQQAAVVEPQPESSPYFIQSHETQELQNSQSQLQASVEKLRSWQITVESQLDDLKHKLAESEQIRERQLENLLDVQMNLEQVSLRYDAELKNRDALIAKINNTRSVCDILQNHCKILTETMQRCISERDRITELHDNQARQIRDLESQFNVVQERYKAKLNCLNQCLNAERTRGELDRQTHKEDRDHLVTCYQSRIEDVSKQLETVKMKLTSANLKIEEMNRSEISLNQQYSEKLNLLNQAVHELTSNKEMLEKLLQDVQSENKRLSEVATEKESIDASLVEAQEKIKQLEAEKSKIENTLENLVLEFQSKEESYKLVINDHKGAAESLGALLKFTRDEMEQMKIHMQTQLSEAEDTLQKAQSEAATVEAKLQSELEASVAQRSELEVECTQGKARESALQLELQAAEDTVNVRKFQIENIKKQTDDAALRFEEEKQRLVEALSINQAAKEKISCELEQRCEEVKRSCELLTATQACAAEKEGMYQAQLDEANSCVLSLQTEIQVLEEHRASAEILAAEREEENLSLLEEVEKLKEEQLSHMENEQLLHAELQEVKNKISSHQAEMGLLKENQALAEAVAAGIEREKLALLVDVETLTKEELALMETQVSLKEELSTSRNCIKTKETEIHDLNTVVSEKQREIERLTIRTDSQDRRGGKLENERSLLLKQLSEKESILEKLKTEHYEERTRKQAELLQKGKRLNELQKEKEILMEKVAVTEKEKESCILECEKKIKLFVSDMETFKKTSEDRSVETGKLTNMIEDVKAQLLDARESLCKDNQKYNAALGDLKKTQQQIKDVQDQLDIAKREASNAAAIADRLKSKYKVEKKRYMDLAIMKTHAPKHTPHPNKAVPVVQLEVPVKAKPLSEFPTPANVASPPTPRSILKSSKAPTPNSAISPRKVTFFADYGDYAGDSSSSSIILDPDETEAIFRDPSLRPAVFAAKRKEKENIALNRRKKAKQESSRAESSTTQRDNPAEKPLIIKSSSDEDGSKFDWTLSDEGSQ